MKTSIEKNPFAVIDATTRDDKKRILELAEEKSFISDPDLCSKARADLTNPRNRLSAEISWLPCVSPKRTKDLLKILRDNPDALLSRLEIEPLARANLMASAMEIIGENLDTAKYPFDIGPSSVNAIICVVYLFVYALVFGWIICNRFKKWDN